MDGYEVTTLEGVGNTRDGVHPVQQRIVDHNASQCGFCTPRMIMSAVDIVKRKVNDLDEQTIRHELEAYGAGLAE